MLKHPKLGLVGVLILFAVAMNIHAQEGTCNFDDKTLSFAGTPLEQAKCLLRKVKIQGRLIEQEIPSVLKILADQEVQVTKARFRSYLLAQGINEGEIGGSLDEALSRGRSDHKDAPQARYFVIHDTSSPNLCEAGRFPENINDSTWNFNNNKLALYTNSGQAHLYITRDGKTTAPQNRTFRIAWRATKLESKNIERRGMFVHIENVQPRHCHPKLIGEEKCKTSIRNRQTGKIETFCNDNIAPDPGFPDPQLKRLALVYIAASIRRGKWLIPAFHAAIDAGIPDGHDDPQNFDLERWSEKISSILNELGAGNQQINQKGTFSNPIIDSQMTDTEAFDGLPACLPTTPHDLCPEEIRNGQRIVAVKYYSSDGLLHQGQLVIHKDLVGDIQQVFKLALDERFPINSVIPMSHRDFRKDGRWDDNLSMEANNTSGFNYRLTTGGASLSKHATGRAIDINTRQNPYVKGDVALPRNGKYDPTDPGTLTADHPIVRLFLKLGWTWGGNWTSLKDYQHFEKP